MVEKGDREGPRLFAHKPKKVSTSLAEIAGSFTPQSMSPGGASSASAAPLKLTQPFINTLRGGFGFLLALNVVLGGYMLFRGGGNRSRGQKVNYTVQEHEQQELKQAEQGKSEQHEAGHSADSGSSEQASKHAASEAVKQAGTAEASRLPSVDEKELEPSWVLESKLLRVEDHPPMSYQDQMAILTWILEEKRKVKPATWTERWKLDEEKGLLKKYIRSGSHLPLKGL